MKIFLGVIVTLLVLALAEIFAFAFILVFPKHFAPSMGLVRSILDFDDYGEFLETRYDEQLGWRNPQGTTLALQDCTGVTRHYSHDSRGARGPISQGQVDIIAVGDSYTYGFEADDQDSYPARLESYTGLVTANFGVTGFGPLQATLQFERAAAQNPEARIAILGIMYENIRRLPNGYRGVLFNDDQLKRNGTSALITFKPYVDATQVEPAMQPNLNMPPAQNMDMLLARIEAAIASDYWARPQASFPYTVSVAKLMVSRNLRFVVQRRFGGKSRFFEFDDPELKRSLDWVIDRFVASAQSRGMKPVILMIPENRFDRTSPNLLMAQIQQSHPQALLLNVGDAEMDWEQYNLNGDLCHPSPYGYDQIARYVAEQFSRHALPEPRNQKDRASRANSTTTLDLVQ